MLNNNYYYINTLLSLNLDKIKEVYKLDVYEKFQEICNNDIEYIIEEYCKLVLISKLDFIDPNSDKQTVYEGSKINHLTLFVKTLINTIKKFDNNLILNYDLLKNFINKSAIKLINTKINTQNFNINNSIENLTTYLINKIPNITNNNKNLNIKLEEKYNTIQLIYSVFYAVKEKYYDNE